MTDKQPIAWRGIDDWERERQASGHWLSAQRKFKRMLRRNERFGVFCSKCETLFNRKTYNNVCPNCEMPIMPRPSKGWRKHVRKAKAKR